VVFVVGSASAQQQPQTVTVSTDNPAVTISAITFIGSPVKATGIGTNTVRYLAESDGEGIPCDSADISIETSDAGHYRPLVNLCDSGWRMTVPTGMPPSPGNTPQIDPALSWNLAETKLDPNESGDDLFLAYAIPETDATMLTVLCRSGAGRARIQFAGWGQDPNQAGHVMQAMVIGQDRVLRYDGIVTDAQSDEENNMVQVEVEIGDPVFKAMAVDYPGVFVGVNGTDFRPIPTAAGAKAIATFVRRCAGG
jgi:hypothetical protein